MRSPASLPVPGAPGELPPSLTGSGERAVPPQGKGQGGKRRGAAAAAMGAPGAGGAAPPAARPAGREGAPGMERGRDGEEELEEEDEEDEGEDGGPESALEKSPFQLTAADVYDISSVVGRDLLQLRAGPQLPAARARLQFRIVRVLEMLEALVSESSVAEEQLRRERDSLRRELEQLRAAARGSAPQPSLGPDQMVIDLTDPNRPRFTLQELRDVLQERNQLKAQLLVVQEELQCYKRVERGTGTCLAGELGMSPLFPGLGTAWVAALEWDHLTEKGPNSRTGKRNQWQQCWHQQGE